MRESLVTWCSFQTSNYCVELRKTCEGSEPKVGARGELARAYKLVRKVNYRFGAALSVSPIPAARSGSGLSSAVMSILYRGCSSAARLPLMGPCSRYLPAEQ